MSFCLIRELSYRCRMSPERESVQRLASKEHRLESIRELLGAVNTRQLRDVTVSDAVFDTLVEGLSDFNPQVRFWSVQLLDHCPDPRAIVAIKPLLDDPVPRVRRNAVHTMACRVCKTAVDRDTGRAHAGQDRVDVDRR